MAHKERKFAWRIGVGLFSPICIAFLAVPHRFLITEETGVSPIPKEVLSRRDKITDELNLSTNAKDPVSEGVAPESIEGQLNHRIGYQSLPPELRVQILKKVLDTYYVRPYRGMSEYERWQKQLKTVRSACWQLLKHTLRYPCKENAMLLFYTMDFYMTNTDPLISIVSKPATLVEPQFLATCRAAYEEGHTLFYSENCFMLPPGPLENSKAYFDNLRPEHRRMIRQFVIDLCIEDLNIEAFEIIESQVRASFDPSRRKRLPPDTSHEHWLAPAAYQLISTWRSKLAWIKEEWPLVDRLDVIQSAFFPTPEDYEIRRSRRYIPRLGLFGRKGVQQGLKGVGPVEPHCPVLDCYRDCSPELAKIMHRVESEAWNSLSWATQQGGWKFTKALIGHQAYFYLSNGENEWKLPNGRLLNAFTDLDPDQRPSFSFPTADHKAMPSSRRSFQP